MKTFSSSLVVAALALHSTLLGGNAEHDEHVNGCLDLSNDRSKCSLSIAQGRNLDLRQCRISGSDVKDLEKCLQEVIDNNSVLNIVNLIGNRLENVLSPGLFGRNCDLKRLNLGASKIETLPNGVFNGLHSLKILDFKTNDLKTLPVRIFYYLTKLERLNFRRNKLTMLPLGVFDTLTSLRFLDFRGNDLNTLPVRVFNSLTGLERLDLGLNNLTALPDEVFYHLTSLRSLHLSGNDLSELPADIFHNLTSLEYLYLHGNGITKLPAGIFGQLTSLKTLWVNDNPDLLCLPTVPTAVTQLKVDDHVGDCDDGFCAPGIPGIFGTTVEGVELCCDPGCKQCGGPECGTASPGLGSSACCHTIIAGSGKECGVAPCILPGQGGSGEEEEAPSAGFCAPDVPGILKTMGNGIDVCCNPGCTQCGGPGCGTATPGLASGDCCTGPIIREGHECGVAPCILHGKHY